ncbi:class I SAM-dependent DNA methyltransferase [Arhodomonas sp. SL1]|uniref:class I SAM-dependent DNA methyltransferase n=1 Tax=Arhodomonas sp. SL1 TaxID=3425691 RepID=UPI003F8842B4
MSSNEEILNKVYNARDHEELMSAYRDWAGDYDRDTVDNFGYVGHYNCAEQLHRFLGDTSARILDAGSGTGLVAEVLADYGYGRMDALDYSAEMLAEARRKGLYEHYYQRDLSRPLDFADDAYDAVVCAGTFTYGHVGADAFGELIRVTRPGGLVVFTIREGAYEEYGYRARMLELETAGRWELLEMRDTDYYRDKARAKFCVYRVT